MKASDITNIEKEKRNKTFTYVVCYIEIFLNLNINMRKKEDAIKIIKIDTTIKIERKIRYVYTNAAERDA